ncbi:nitrate/nitrite sensor histidine kinase NarQ [Erwinia sp. Ejp617]|nr:histidine kinase [Erwinia sp. Ejp617]ADP13244.1 nitrate/nitrite sensor histidine kinase NarQ [Erwinia sp. Ejp617]
MKHANVRQANRRLRLLIACSELLSHSTQGQRAFQQTLALVVSHEKLAWLELSAPEFGVLSAGKQAGQTRWHSLSLRHPSRPPGGKLRWQGARPQRPIIKSLAAMLANALERWRNQQQIHGLLIQQERATIAAELHDSLAQELTFQRIQLVRLRRAIEPDDTTALDIVAGMEQSLTGASRQLRELLNNFRLTVAPASLAHALEQAVAPLHQQSSAHITLACQFSGQLAAQQQIHVVHIVREALVNAVRHASATEISVGSRPLPQGGIAITIKDNGVGIASLEEPDGHHGLNIMNERAARLNGTLLIERHAKGGTSVSLHFTPMTEIF